jgi:hypothetical protein
MFFRLPFPDGQRMEKVHARANVTQDVRTFLADMQCDFDNVVQSMSDLKNGWQHYLRTEMKVSDDQDTGAPSKVNNSVRRARTSSPTIEEIQAAEVCSLQYLHQHAGR